MNKNILKIFFNYHLGKILSSIIKIMKILHKNTEESNLII